MVDVRTKRVRWLADLRLADRPTVGGKGASLGELMRAGVAVPNGFVLTTAAFEAFLGSLDPGGKIRLWIRSLIGADTAKIAHVCAEIRVAVESAALDADFEREIVEAYGRLFMAGGGGPVAVRSSATSEDHAEASFAGLQDTILWVDGIEAVLAAVKKCWSSLYSVESVTYRLRLNIPEEEVAMAVAVQDMVDAQAAGVMFTRSPTSGDKSVIVIEATWGLGSALVGGEVTPDKFVVSKITGEIGKREVSRKLLQHVPSLRDKRVVEIVVPDELQAVSCLGDDEIHKLAETAKIIERHYGHPQDIEWAIEKRDRKEAKILILQSRPETVWSNRAKPESTSGKADQSSAEHVLRTLVKRGE